jgi:phospholipase/carboxylesterase
MLTHVSSPDAALAPRVALLLHGYGADERDLAGLAGYLPRGLAWASVRAPNRGPGPGYSWFSLEGTDFGESEAVEAATELLWEWVDANCAPDARLVPIGFSQGGLMASQLLRTRPTRIEGIALLSGYVMDAPQPADDVLAQTRPRAFWGRGTADVVIPQVVGELTEAWLPEYTSLESHIYQGLGHAVSEAELADLQRFVASVVSPT